MEIYIAVKECCKSTYVFFTYHSSCFFLSLITKTEGKYYLFYDNTKRFDLCDSTFIQFIYFSHGLMCYNNIHMKTAFASLKYTLNKAFC